MSRTALVAAFVLTLTFALAAPVPAMAEGTQGAPSAPTNLRITASTDMSVSLAWDASQGSSSTWWYCVSTGGSSCFRVDPPKTTFTWSTNIAGGTWNFSVFAIDSHGNRSASSNTVTFSTPPDTTPPGPAPVVSVGAVFPTRISINWTASSDNTGQVSYRLTVDGVPQSFEQFAPSGFTMLYVQPSSTHTFQVTARDRYGNSVSSNVLTVTTPAATESVPPTAPTNLRTQGALDNEIWFEWDQSTDNADPQGQILYDIYLNGVRADAAFWSNTTSITYCVNSGPTEMFLRAVDTSGNVSGPSNTVTVTCP
jgi:chitodextrinase